MLDYAGSLQRIALSRTLWLVVAWPVLGVAWQALVVRRRVTRARRQRRTADAGVAGASGRFAGIAFIVLTSASTLLHLVALEGAPGGAQALFEQGPRGGRFGWLDVDFALCFDGLSAAACAFACLITLAAALFLARRQAAQRGWRDWAWLQLALAGSLVTFLADGFVAMAFGWGLAGAAGAWLAGWQHPRLVVVAASRSAVAMAALLVGAALIFWGLAGSWGASEYGADSSPRVVAVRERVPTLAGDSRQSDTTAVPRRAALTLAGAPGTLVFVDEARTPSFRAPFVHVPLDVGTRVFHLRRGNEPDDEAVGPLSMAPGEEVALVPVGPTLAFRAIADQLTLRDASGEEPVRRALVDRLGPGDSAIVAAALAAWLVAVGAGWGAVRCGGAPPELAAVASASMAAAVGPYLLARVSFLFPLAPYTGTAVGWLGGAMLAGAVWRAVPFAGSKRWVVFAGGAPAALSCVALAVGGVADGMRVMGVAGAVSAMAHFHAARRSPDWDDSNPARDPLDAAFLVALPTRLGALLMGMERWVVEAVAGTASGAVRATGWVFAQGDRHIVSAPGDFAAAQLVRAARVTAPALGGSLSRAAWAVLVAIALAVAVSVLTHAFRARG